jgi:hypothetical protein
MNLIIAMVLLPHREFLQLPGYVIGSSGVGVPIRVDAL